MTSRAMLAMAVFLAAGEALAAPTTQECIGASESSIRLRREQKLLRAREQSMICADAACPAEIRTECSQKVVELSTAIPTLVLSATSASGNDIVDVHVMLDGKPFMERLDGRSVQLDPGAHVFRFEAAGQAPVEKTIVLREGEHDRRKVIRFESLASSSGARDPGRRTAGLVVGSIGIAGLGLGIVATAVAASLSSSSKTECPQPQDGPCSDYAQSQKDYEAARVWAHVAEVGFVGGGVFLAVGGIVFFTAPWVTPGKTTGLGVDFGARF